MTLARRVTFFMLCVALVVACRRTPAERRELGSVEGGYLYTTNEGTSSETARYDQASAALARGDTKAARALYQTIALREPDRAEPHVGLGACAMGEKDLPAAEAEYRLALKKDPRSSSAHIGLGGVAMDRGDPRTAAGEYELALALAETPDAHWGAAIAYDALGDRPRAAAHARRFLALAPDSAYAPAARAMAAR